jgi:hypothetical protein
MTDTADGGANVRVMRRELSNGDFNALDGGELVAPDGRTYARRGTRLKRKDVAALVAAGSPVVTWSPGGALVWHDGADAGPAWDAARTLLTTDAPDTARRESVTAGKWDAVDGSALVVLLHHH